MNTTAKGDQLENEVFDLISKEVEDDHFAFSRDHCKVFRKKGYYSRDRESDIIFDVSIEVRLDKDQEEFSFLFLIECKNYTGSIPVNDVEEFFTKTQQVAACAAKAILISKGTFQSGAFSFARAKRMGLARYDSAGLDWILRRSPSALALQRGDTYYEEGARRGLCDASHVSQYFDFHGYSDDSYTHSLNQFFGRLLTEGERGDGSFAGAVHGNRGSALTLVPYVDARFIESEAKELLAKVGYRRGEVPLDLICGHLESTRGLIVALEALPAGVLGEIAFDPPRISIDREQSQTDQRARFTLAHELGHFGLSHDRYIKRDVVRAADIDLGKPSSVAVKDLVRMEIQANLFASYLLTPSEQLLNATVRSVNALGLRLGAKRQIYLDEQPCNITAYHALAMQLGKKFGVSKTVITLRLKELGLLTERNDACPVGTVANEALKSLHRSR